MSVSRVVYDAALTRVTEELRRLCNNNWDGTEEPCVLLTLAALGLDEPPTEEAKPVHTQECEDRAFIFHASTGDDAPCICGAAVPPAEPPKACPTCEGRGYFDRRGGLQDDCHYCLGTGIDGGTAA